MFRYYNTKDYFNLEKEINESAINGVTLINLEPGLTNFVESRPDSSFISRDSIKELGLEFKKNIGFDLEVYGRRGRLERERICLQKASEDYFVVKFSYELGGREYFDD